MLAEEIFIFYELKNYKYLLSRFFIKSVMNCLELLQKFKYCLKNLSKNNESQ